MLISIEGIDGSGKKTISMALRHEFKEKGFLETLNLTEFPRYTGPLGADIELSLMKGGNQNFLPMLFAYDRLLWWKEIADSYSYSDNIEILDRFSLSNAAYQATIKGDLDYGLELLDFEHRVFNIPVPDFTFLIRPNWGLVKNELRNRKKTDAYEKVEFLKKVYRNYEKLCFEKKKEMENLGYNVILLANTYFTPTGKARYIESNYLAGEMIKFVENNNGTLPMIYDDYNETEIL